MGYGRLHISDGVSVRSSSLATLLGTPVNSKWLQHSLFFVVVWCHIKLYYWNCFSSCTVCQRKHFYKHFKCSGIYSTTTLLYERKHKVEIYLFSIHDLFQQTPKVKLCKSGTCGNTEIAMHFMGYLLKWLIIVFSF